MNDVGLKMNITFILLSALTLSFLFGQPGIAVAAHSEKHSTPYGDYCRKYSHYGRNKTMHGFMHAVNALKHYYSKKGLDIKVISPKGRFIKVNILKNNEIVDTILFDRHTGRIRSIY
jgi:hypothetical protein